MAKRALLQPGTALVLSRGQWREAAVSAEIATNARYIGPQEIQGQRLAVYRYAAKNMKHPVYYAQATAGFGSRARRSRFGNAELAGGIQSTRMPSAASLIGYPVKVADGWQFQTHDGRTLAALKLVETYRGGFGRTEMHVWQAIIGGVVYHGRNAGTNLLLRMRAGKLARRR